MVNARLIAACLVLAATSAAAETITGQARVIDGDTLDLGGVPVRLEAVDTPGLAQWCEGPKTWRPCDKFETLRAGWWLTRR